MPYEIVCQNVKTPVKTPTSSKKSGNYVLKFSLYFNIK